MIHEFTLDPNAAAEKKNIQRKEKDNFFLNIWKSESGFSENKQFHW